MELTTTRLQSLGCIVRHLCKASKHKIASQISRHYESGIVYNLVSFAFKPPMQKDNWLYDRKPILDGPRGAYIIREFRRLFECCISPLGFVQKVSKINLDESRIYVRLYSSDSNLQHAATQ
jgi:hypothetical protein